MKIDKNINIKKESKLQVVQVDKLKISNLIEMKEKIVFRNATQTYCNNLKEILKLIDEEL